MHRRDIVRKTRRVQLLQHPPWRRATASSRADGVPWEPDHKGPIYTRRFCIKNGGERAEKAEVWRFPVCVFLPNPVTFPVPDN